MHNLTISKVTLTDINRLQQISSRTFYETFAQSNTPENMENYLQQAFSVEKLTSEINNPNTEFYFALSGTEVIGYLKLNFGKAQTEVQNNQSVEIERIYVLQAYHGKQVGQLLYDTAIQIARQKNAAYVWLGVWENNPRAIRFYQKNGFVAFGKHLFQLGNDEQTDIMMKLDLQ